MKTVLTGAGIALAAGLVMGAVAKPDLRADGRPEGPQFVAGAAGARSTGPFDDGATFASYKGQIPDYVLGTDWKKAVTPPPERTYRVAEPKLARNDDPPVEPVRLTHATYDEPPHAAPVYPSLQGGAPGDAGGSAAASEADDGADG